MKHGVLAACIGAGGMVFTAVVCVIKPQPLYDPRIVVPITGMVLGNAFSAVSLALRTVLMELAEHPVAVKSALYFGADRQEALKPSIITALTTALTPSINSMTVIGTTLRTPPAFRLTLGGLLACWDASHSPIPPPPRPPPNRDQTTSSMLLLTCVQFR